MRVSRMTTFVVAMLFGFSAFATAATITFENEVFASGSGIGSVPTILVLQGAGNNTTETGAVAWTGVADSETGDAKSQSQTWTVTALSGIGISSADTQFGLVINVDETSGADTIDLQNLRLDFFSSTGTLLFSATYFCVACPYPLPLNLDETAQGVGSSGFLFRVTLSAAEQALFFGSGANRVGAYGSIFNIDNGPETWYLSDLEPDEPLVPVPEPATLLLLGSGLMGASKLFRWRARRAPAGR